jgi:hypothetical protein
MSVLCTCEMVRALVKFIQRQESLCGDKHAQITNCIYSKGTAVAQWLRYCATNQKVAGSIPDGVMEFSLI